MHTCFGNLLRSSVVVTPHDCFDEPGHWFGEFVN